MVPRVFLLLLFLCDQVLVDGQVSELIIGSRANALGDIKVTFDSFVRQCTGTALAGADVLRDEGGLSHVLFHRSS